MKISEDPEKSTVPGRKQVYRLMDTDGGNSSSLLLSFSCTRLKKETLA